MTIFRIAIFTTPILFFMIFSMPPASAIVPTEVNRVECTDISQIPEEECNALAAFYDEMDGLDWDNNKNWRKTDDPCGEDRDLGWYGVGCENGHVTELSLVGTSSRAFGLTGDLSAEIGDLPYLKEIDFMYNELRSLPAEIGKLQRLEMLWLSHNYLEGLPAEIGQLSSLIGIYLCFNELETAPAEIGNLSNLKNLYFDHNKLREVPAEVGRLSNVKVVRFNHNELTTLPAEIGNLSKLEKLYINNNPLILLPINIVNLADLSSLNAGYNHLVSSMEAAVEDWLNTYDPDWRSTQTYPLTECRTAHLLQIGASPQPHSFHQVRDEDWFEVDLQEGISYALLASGNSRNAQPEIEIHSNCDTSPVVSGPAFGNDNELIFTANSSQRYYVKIWNRDVNIFGQDVTYDVSISVQDVGGVDTPTQPEANDLAIIVTGHNDLFELQTHIFNAANRAYKVFSGAEISRDHIRYLGMEGDDRGDVDGDGKSEIETYATVASAKEVITQWPLGKVNSESRIFIYLISHGLNDYMMVDGEDDRLRAEVLDGWLDDLELATGASIIVIYEACQSGSFITRPNSISKPGRVIITSTDAEHNAYPVTQSGAQFSDAFFSALRWGKHFKESFDIGRNTSVSTLQLQHPQLDDNGDGEYTRADGTLAEALLFLPFTSPSRPVNVPILHTSLFRPNIDYAQGVIQVQASNAHYVKMVWADIYPPDYVEPPISESGVSPGSGAETIELSDADGDGVYEGAYHNFTQEENYRIVFYGYDMEGDAIMTTSFNIPNGPVSTPIEPSKIYLPMIIR